MVADCAGSEQVPLDKVSGGLFVGGTAAGAESPENSAQKEHKQGKQGPAIGELSEKGIGFHNVLLSGLRLG